jgi:hypothetical protein
VLDWFAQHDVATWNAANEDLNSGGVLMIPHNPTPYLLGGGKQGRFFLVDSGNLGHYNATDSQIVQTFQATNGNPQHIFGSPVYYVSPTLGTLAYVWAEQDFLKGFSFNGSTFNPSPVTQSLVTAAPGMPGGFLSLSANGAQPGTGILWATMPYSLDAENAVVTGILRAFDASDLSVELWNSRDDYIRDDYGNFAKYVPPTVANGKVYVSTFSGHLAVYGLNPPLPSGITFMQQANAIPQQPAATVLVSYASSQFAGDLNVVVVGWNDTTASIQSVTDSRGNSYQLAVGPTKGNGLSQAIYYATNIVGGSNTVTVQFDQPASYPDIQVLEYYGVESVNPVDVVAGASGNGGQSSTGAVTTTTANDLLFAANTVSTTTTQASFPFIARVITPDGDIAQDAVVNAAGIYTPAATLSPAGSWVMQMVAFKGRTASSSAPFPSVSLSGSSLTIHLTANASNGKKADWWLVALTPWGHWYSYIYPNGWVDVGTDLSRVLPAYQGPLVDIPNMDLFDITGIPSGNYRVYFGVDTNMNGLLDYDQLSYSSLSLTAP